MVDYFRSNICDGSILSRYYVLTPTHCIEDIVHTPVLLLIVVGIDSLNSLKGQRPSLSRIFIHPNYDRGTKVNDIAILYLSQPIDFTDIKVTKI